MDISGKSAAKDEELYTISIPNKGIRNSFSSMIIDRMFDDESDSFINMFEAVKAGDVPNVEKNMKNLFYSKFPLSS